MTTAIGVFVLLGGLIFFHEFGHYLVAKLFGVKVEVFSLGFGKKLLRRRVGETEYCLSIFPLGGYVKLMGDDPYRGVPADEAHRAFSTQKLYRRFLIVAAGPMANLLLAFVLFMVVFGLGQPVPAAKLGHVAPDSGAWTAGLRSGDRVLSVDGTSVSSWRELEEAFSTHSSEKVTLRIARSATELDVPVPLGKVRGRNPYGEEIDQPGLPGTSNEPLLSLVGVSDPTSVAAKSGLKSGDWITKVGTRSVKQYVDLEDAIRASFQPGQPIVVAFQRKPTEDAKDFGPEQTTQFALTALPEVKAASPHGLAQVLGLQPYDTFVFRVTAGSPAEKAGLKAGDRITAVAGKQVQHFDTVIDIVRERGGRGEAVPVTVERDGKSVDVAVTPTETEQEDPLTRNKVKRFLMGVVSGTATDVPEMTKIRVTQPVALVKRAAGETFELAYRMVISLGKLVTGQLSMKNLGGPVLIASVAGKSLDAGIVQFLQMMALISINLFLLNLFPVPILDGGHLLFFTIEAIQGKPVSVRTMEIANQVGMVFILMLVGLTFFNDISRIVLH